MSAYRVTDLIRIAEWEGRRYRNAAGDARMLGDDRTAVQFDNMAAYYAWRVQQLELVRLEQRERKPTFREWLATPAARTAAQQFANQSTLF